MFVIWLITSRCNLNCSHCYVKGRDLGQELPPNEALTLAEKIVELAPTRLTLLVASLYSEEIFLRL